MMSARVAGVPIPFSCRTAEKSSSSICWPAFSISESSRASVMRAGGLVSSASLFASSARTATSLASSAPGTSAGSGVSSSSLVSASTERQPGTTSVRARVRKLSLAATVVRSTRSHCAGGWNAPKKRRATRSNRRLSSPVSGSRGIAPVGTIAK